MPSGRAILALSIPSNACFKNSMSRAASGTVRQGVIEPQSSGIGLTFIDRRRPRWWSAPCIYELPSSVERRSAAALDGSGWATIRSYLKFLHPRICCFPIKSSRRARPGWLSFRQNRRNCSCSGHLYAQLVRHPDHRSREEISFVVLVQAFKISLERPLGLKREASRFQARRLGDVFGQRARPKGASWLVGLCPRA